MQGGQRAPWCPAQAGPGGTEEAGEDTWDAAPLTPPSGLYTWCSDPV